MPNYLDAILSLEPDYEVSVIGDPAVYANIDWGSETPIAQVDLDAVITAATLNQVKNAKKREIRASRDEALSRLVAYSGANHEMTPPMLSYLIAAVTHVAGGGSLPGTFKVLKTDGTGVAADITYCEGLLSNALTQQKNHVDTYIARIATIDACGDEACVAAVTW